MTQPETMGSILRATRRSRGLSIQEVAEFLGITKQSISRWELDQSKPRRRYLDVLCTWWDLDYGYVNSLRYKDE